MSDPMDMKESTRPPGCLIIVAIMAALVVAGIAAVLLYDALMRGKVGAQLEQIRAAGQPVAFEEVLRMRDNVPDDQNAALVMGEALTVLDNAPLAVPISDIYSLVAPDEPGVRCSDVALKLAQRQFAEHAKVLEIARRAAQLETGVYPLKPEEVPFAIVLPHLLPLRDLTRLCACQTVATAQSGDGAAAALSVKDGLRARASLGEGWTIPEAVVGFTCDAITYGSLECAMQLGEMRAEDVRMLRGELARQEQTTDMTSAFIGERAMGIFAFSASREELNRLSGGKTVTGMGLYCTMPGLREKDALFYLDVMGRYVEACSLPEREQMAESQRILKSFDRAMFEGGPNHILSAMLMPAMRKALGESLKARVRLRVARTALAVEEYRMANGHWPDTLYELVPQYLDAVPPDAFSDGPLRYVLDDEGALVYSLGTNAEDEGGLRMEDAPIVREIQHSQAWDIPFRLLDPELRGARQSTFRDDVMRSSLNLKALEPFGFDRGRLREMGLTEDQIQTLISR